MDAARGARQKIFLLKKPKSPKMDAKPAYRLKVLKVSTIKGGLALKELLRAPKYVRGAHGQRGTCSRVRLSGCCTGPGGSSCPHVVRAGDSEAVHVLKVSTAKPLAPDS